MASMSFSVQSRHRVQIFMLVFMLFHCSDFAEQSSNSTTSHDSFDIVRLLQMPQTGTSQHRRPDGQPKRHKARQRAPSSATFVPRACCSIHFLTCSICAQTCDCGHRPLHGTETNKSSQAVLLTSQPRSALISFLGQADFPASCAFSCVCPFCLELPRHCHGPTVIEAGGVLPRCRCQCFHRSHVLGPAVLRGPSTQLESSPVCRTLMNSSDGVQSLCDRLKHLGCCGLEYSSSYRSAPQQRACGVSPRQRSRALQFLRQPCSGDLRKGRTSSQPGLGLANACGGVPRAKLSVDMYLDCYWQDRSCNCQYASYLCACGAQPRWPSMFTIVSGGFRVPKILPRPRSGNCGVLPPRQKNPRQCTGRYPGSSQTEPLCSYGSGPHLCACGALPRQQGRKLQFMWHPCSGDFREGGNSSSKQGTGLDSSCQQSHSNHTSVPQSRVCGALPAGLLAGRYGTGGTQLWQHAGRSQTVPLHPHGSGPQSASPRNQRQLSDDSGGLGALQYRPRARAWSKDQVTLRSWGSCYLKATVISKISRATCHLAKDPKAGRRKHAPNVELAARAPAARVPAQGRMRPPSRRPRWSKGQRRLVTARRKPNHRRAQGLSQRSRSRSKHHPAAAPARTPVIWSARPRTPEGSSSRLPLPCRWGETRRITSRCWGLIFACLFFSLGLVQTCTSPGHLDTHPPPTRRRSGPCSAALVNAVKCWCGQLCAVRATFSSCATVQLGHNPQVRALHGLACQFLACAIPFCLMPGLLSYFGCTLCVQVPLLLGERISTGPMKLPMCLPGWLDSSVMVCRSLRCPLWLLASRCALQVASQGGEGRPRGRFCLMLCLCLPLVGLVPGMYSNNSGGFWVAQILPRHQPYDCMSLRPDRKCSFGPVPHSIAFAECADASGPNSVFQISSFFGNSGAMGQSKRSQATKLRSANRPGKRERACIQTTIKLTASAKGAARKPLDRRLDAPTFPPPPPPPPRRERAGHVEPQAAMLASWDRHLAHRTPSSSSGTEPNPISPDARLDALRGRLHRKLIESCHGMTDFMPTFSRCPVQLWDPIPLLIAVVQRL